MTVRIAGKALGTIATVSALIAGCSSEINSASPPAESRSSASTTEGTGSTGRGATKLAELTTREGDVEPVRSLTALAAESPLVIQGSIVKFLPGRTAGGQPGQPGARSYVTVAARVDATLKGTAPGSTVYFELPNFAEQSAGQQSSLVDDLNSRLATDNRIVAYLRHTDSDYTNPDAGRPAGEPIYVAPAGGLVMETADGLIEMSVGTRYPGATVKDFVPARGSLPTAAPE